MCNPYKFKRFFTFDRVVGYATIAGSIATLYGVKKIYNLTIELKPAIEIIQEKRVQHQNVIRDTITIICRDTVICRDTIFLSFRDSIYPVTPKNNTRSRIEDKNKAFRKRHQLP